MGTGDHTKVMAAAKTSACECRLAALGKDVLRKEAALRLCRQIEAVCESSAAEVARLEGRLAQCEAAAGRREAKLIEERDRAEAVVARACTLLGGDSEWTHRTPPVPPPESGDLLQDLPALAEAAVATVHRCEDLLAQFLTLLPQSVRSDTVVVLPRPFTDVQLAVKVAETLRDVRAAYPREPQANGAH